MEALALQNTLRIVARAMDESFRPESRWGLAGFAEGALVLLVAETFHKCGWSVRYERPYEGCKKRRDIDASRNQESLCLEAKWWWCGASLAPVLARDEEKLRTVPNKKHAIALVFTVDVEGYQSGELQWTKDGAEKWMGKCLEDERLIETWKLIGCATASSPYMGAASGDDDDKQRNGLFAAAFFEYLPSRPR